MIMLFFIENSPWVYWCDLGATTNAGRWGEWAWVGRVYDYERE